MFDETLHPSWNERSRRGWTTLTSFGLQALVAGTLLVLPLLRPMGLPMLHQLSTPVSLGRLVEDPAPARTRAGTNQAAATDPADIAIRMPTRIPASIPTAGDDAAPPVGVGSATSGETAGGD